MSHDDGIVSIRPGAKYRQTFRRLRRDGEPGWDRTSDLL